jgi:hypothetical protein
MSTFVVVPGAWDTPATMEPLIDPLESAGHLVTMLVPPEAQRVMAASVGADVVEIDTDHGFFRERPERLAEMLVAGSR